MNMLILMATAIGLIGSGVPGLFCHRRSATGQHLAMAINVAASAVGMAAVLWHDIPRVAAEGWHPVCSLPIGKLALSLDDMSAWFLLPIFLISALGSIYGLGYWPQRKHPVDGRKLRLFWGLMSGAMVLVVLAANSVWFLIAWEIMALSGYFLLTTEDGRPEVRQSGWVYFIATHLATLCLIALFLLLRIYSGSFHLWPRALVGLPVGVLTALFLLGLIGFGFKAGLVPLHVWLPAGHANAPSHVSALFSGVMLNMGIYGIMRVVVTAGRPPLWWGVVLISVGMLSAFSGITWAMAQRDFKRLLAYSSIENIGIITTGLGLAVLGLSVNEPIWVALGLGGALLHTLNHSLFKPLLFMGAGGIIHGAKTRDMESLGGLAARMPAVFRLMLLGSAAIAALPPLNGFVSEMLIYLGFFQTLHGATAAPWAAWVVPALALVGALALMTFVKLTATCFVGQPRSATAAGAHDPAATMLWPMVLLAAACVLVGAFPVLLMGLLDHAIAAWVPSHRSIPLVGIINVWWITALALPLMICSVGIAWWVHHCRKSVPETSVGTWDCGYAAPRSRMQYTGSSLMQTMAVIFRRILWRREQPPKVHGIFPLPADYACNTPDPLLDRVAEPALKKVGHILESARILQSGAAQLYMLYILLIVLILLMIR